MELSNGHPNISPPAAGDVLQPEHIPSSLKDDHHPKIQNRIEMIQPLSQLPTPEPPPGVATSPPFPRSKSLSETITVDTIGKFFKQRSTSLSASITNRLSSFKINKDHPIIILDDDNDHRQIKINSFATQQVTEFQISGLKVTVSVKNDDGVKPKGRISFFSRSNCRDCTAVRSFLRERGLKFVEINIDVFPQREKELMDRTGGSCQVPQIFFNDNLFGGLVALNSLRNSGGFDDRLKEMLGGKCSGEAPAAPVYGFDDPEEETSDDMVEVVRVLRLKLPIQDRVMRMKMVKNCFGGSQMVEVLIHHLDCGRKKAVEIGKQLARKHFIHHVFGENDFEDGNHFYRFLEHQPFIPKCYNFRGSTNDSEPKSAIKIGQRLHKIMSAILECYASDDRSHIDYVAISKSEEFRRFVNLVEDLQRVDLLALSTTEKLAFFLNLHNAMVIHAVIRVGCPEGIIDRRSFYTDFQYIVGGYSYSLNTIKNGILRSNRRSPYSLVKPFGSGDKRLEIVLPKVNPIIHFGTCNGTKSSPTVRFFTAQGVEAELKYAAREFFQRSGMEVDLEKRSVYLSRIIKWFDADFGNEKEILKWIMNYLDPTKAGLLTHLLGDGGPVNIVYQNYDWSVNS
ncbi:glutaredoxin-related [Euphorbia peplus]|nr:glutaredoxin-related [Euphorbia peplus]